MSIIDFIIKKFGTDRLLHYFVCWALFLTFRLVLPSWGAAVAVAVIGILKEVVDAFRGHGFDIIDFCADVAGILTGWILSWLSSFVG